MTDSAQTFRAVMDALKSLALKRSRASGKSPPLPGCVRGAIGIRCVPSAIFVGVQRIWLHRLGSSESSCADLVSVYFPTSCVNQVSAKAGFLFGK